jgi:hypothetical protein
LTPDSIQQKYAQTVVSKRIAPGCVPFLGEEERFYTAWTQSRSVLKRAIVDNGWAVTQSSTSSLGTSHPAPKPPEQLD